jgi:hypothetical protein
MSFTRIIFITMVCLFSTGCATNAIHTFSSQTDYSDLYLRGVFTWWEADEKYKLQPIADGVYATQIELIADGQPYDFKFADAAWSPNKNCGYASLRSDQVVEVNKIVSANCETNDENFRFTPQETGLYQFSIDFSGFGSPTVLVTLLSD